MARYHGNEKRICASAILNERRQWKTCDHGAQAQEAATFLGQKIWGKPSANEPEAAKRTTKILDNEVGINTEYITMEELFWAIKKLKRRKTPGPDGIPIEWYKEMDEEMLGNILALLNEWWNNEFIPTDVLRARVVLIFKRGD